MDREGEILKDTNRHRTSDVAVIISSHVKSMTGATSNSFTSLSSEPSLIHINPASAKRQPGDGSVMQQH